MTYICKGTPPRIDSTQPSSFSPPQGMVTHRGSCHCRAVTFEVDTPSASIIGWDCNCSVCLMKRNVHFVVPSQCLRITQGEDRLSEYTFNTRVAKHLFCKICGVVPFYRPRSNPDGYAITVHCIEPGTITDIEVKHFDGVNWEGTIDKSGIRAQSKT